jgi:hypothetical protein
MQIDYRMDVKRDLMLVEVSGKVSIPGLLNEINNAITDRRGYGMRHRLIDLSRCEFMYTVAEGRQLLGALERMTYKLQNEKLALVFKEIQSSYVLQKLVTGVDLSALNIGIFLERSAALNFLLAY